MFTEHHPVLQKLLTAIRPATVLVVDPRAEPLPALAQAEEPLRITHVRSAQLEHLEGVEPFAFGVIANTLERLDAKSAGILLSRMRDLHTQRFVALIPIGDEWAGLVSYWQDNDLLAYGMTLMARFEREGKPLALYHFNLADYKTTPDWLNSRFWANPERWEP